VLDEGGELDEGRPTRAVEPSGSGASFSSEVTEVRNIAVRRPLQLGGRLRTAFQVQDHPNQLGE
jgi:hypothetical protein